MYIKNQTLASPENHLVNEIYNKVQAGINEHQILNNAFQKYLTELNNESKLELSECLISVIPLLMIRYFDVNDVYIENVKYIFSQFVFNHIISPSQKGKQRLPDNVLISIAANIEYFITPLEQSNDPRIVDQIDPNADFSAFHQFL